MSEQIITKQCSKCKEIKPLSEFYRDCTCKDGYKTACKICKKKYRKTPQGKTINRKYLQSPKGKATRKAYRESEKGKEVQKRYRQSQKGIEVYRISSNNWSKSEKGKERMRQYKNTFPEQVKARTAVNHAIRAGKLPHPDSLQCYYCPAKAGHYHHWHGYAEEHWLDVIPVCAKCHGKLRIKKT